jgi:glycosyltransferase involved in cell wall biosynthesis
MPVSPHNSLPAHNPLEGDRPDLTIRLQEDGTDERISIVVIHRDRPELLNMCLQSVAITSVNNNIEIIVVDNGSTTKDAIDYLEVLQKEQDLKVIRNETNRWWAAACNQGARAADRKSKYLVFLHQDCVVLNPAWLDLMVSIGEAQGSGMIGLEEGVFQFDRQKIRYVQEWCLMLSRECWRDCGPFVEELKQVGSSFVMTIAAQRFGYKPTVIGAGTKSLVHHYRAFSMDSSEFEKMGEQSAVLIPKLIRDIQQKPER